MKVCDAAVTKPASTQKPTTKDDFFARVAPKPAPTPRPTPSVTKPAQPQPVSFLDNMICFKNSNVQTQAQKANTVKPKESAEKSEKTENTTKTIAVDDLTHVIKCEDLDFWDTVYSKSRLFGCYNKFVNVSFTIYRDLRNKLFQITLFQKCIRHDTDFYKKTDITLGVILYYFWHFITPFVIIHKIIVCYRDFKKVN